MIRIKNFISIEKILDYLPHRFPFLLIDKIIDYKKNFFLYALKNITANDFIFGHFPKKFIFPGVLIVESIAQASGILSIISKNIRFNQKFFYLVSIQNAFFIHPVYPGDQMIIKILYKKRRLDFDKFYGIALVNDIIVCKTTLLLSVS